MGAGDGLIRGLMERRASNHSLGEKATKTEKGRMGGSWGKGLADEAKPWFAGERIGGESGGKKIILSQQLSMKTREILTRKKLKRTRPASQGGRAIRIRKFNGPAVTEKPATDTKSLRESLLLSQRNDSKVAKKPKGNYNSRPQRKR